MLYSLHHLTNLPALGEEEVLKLLQKVPAKDLQREHGELAIVSSQCVPQVRDLSQVRADVSSREMLF